jgi:hypothetical protein
MQIMVFPQRRCLKPRLRNKSSAIDHSGIAEVGGVDEGRFARDEIGSEPRRRWTAALPSMTGTEASLDGLGTSAFSALARRSLARAASLC